MPQNRSEYYSQVKHLARQVRQEHGLESYCVKRSDLRRVYRACGIDHFDLWPPKNRACCLRKLRGAYFCDDYGCSIMVDRSLPDEPAIFTMAHELKHHLMDREVGSALYCDETNQNEHIEIGAEIFAAELIFPDGDFLEHINARGLVLGKCTPDAIVHFKRATSTTLSYLALSKRVEFHRLAPSGVLTGFKGWKKLEESLYGEPIYKRIQRNRRNTG